MAITTRAGKGSALTHAELDANFTTLGLAHGDTVANLDVSSIIVQSSLLAKGTAYNSITLERIAGSGEGANDLQSCLFRSDYSVNSHNLQDNQSAGMFAWIVTADKSDVLGGGVKWRTDNVTDTNNFHTEVQITSYETVDGIRREVIHQFAPDKITLGSPLRVKNYIQTEINSLTAQKGTIIFNSTVNQFQGWDGSSWVNLGYTG